MTPLNQREEPLARRGARAQCLTGPLRRVGRSRDARNSLATQSETWVAGKGIQSVPLPAPAFASGSTKGGCGFIASSANNDRISAGTAVVRRIVRRRVTSGSNGFGQRTESGMDGFGRTRASGARACTTLCRPRIRSEFPSRRMRQRRDNGPSRSAYRTIYRAHGIGHTASGTETRVPAGQRPPWPMRAHGTCVGRYE